MRRIAGLLLLFGSLLAGCAPISMSPNIMRLGTPVAGTFGGGVGLRSGPRTMTPLAAEGRPGVDFHGDASPFAIPQWSVSYDFFGSYAIDHAWELHLGGQGELAFPLPIPGYGLYAGVSRRFGLGAFAITPALSLRGASDFGFGSALGGPGAVAGAELSTAFVLEADPKLRLAFVPFFQGQNVWSLGQMTRGMYVGGVVAARVDYGIEGLEFSAGFGRVFLEEAPDWNAPIFGIRLTR